MLTKNAQQFKAYLQKQDINLRFFEEDNGRTRVEIRESLESGGRMGILIDFNKEDSLVNIYGTDFLAGLNPVKRNYMYEVVNDLNAKYVCFKYVLIEDSLVIQAFALFDNNFKSEVVMRLVVGMMNAVDEDYSKLMRIVWA